MPVEEPGMTGDIILICYVFYVPSEQVGNVHKTGGLFHLSCWNVQNIPTDYGG